MKIAFTENIGHICSFTHRILALILTAAAGLAFDALPPQRLDSHRELRGELETGRVACRYVETHKHTRTHVKLTLFSLLLTDSHDPLASLQREKRKLLLELKALAGSNLTANRVFKPKRQSV